MNLVKRVALQINLKGAGIVSDVIFLSSWYLYASLQRNTMLWLPWQV